MKTITTGLSIAALTLALGGIAHAAQDQRSIHASAPMTRAQAQAKAEAMFDKHDANHDGKLDQADRAAKMAQRFDQIDTDRNGALSREEFASGHQRMGQRGDHAGHDGAMGGEAGRKGMRGARHGRDGGMMMKMADANKDGAVTRAEATAGALKHFEMMDTNKDGTVTPDERKASHTRMRDMWKAKRAAAPAAAN